MMPSLVRAIVVRWKEDTVVEDTEVVEDTKVVEGTPAVRSTKVIGGTPAVKRTKVVIYQESHPFSFYTEGGPVDEREVVRQYILTIRPDEMRNALYKAYIDGLLRAYEIQQKAIEKPQVPSAVAPAGP